MPIGRSQRPPWQDEDDLDDEGYPPWAGPGIIPRYADQEERDRRRLGDPRDVPDRGRSPRGGRPSSGGGPGDGGRPGQSRRPARGRAADAGSAADAAWEEADEPGSGGGRDGGERAAPLGRTRAASGRIRRTRRAIWFRAGGLVLVIVIGVAGWLILGRKPAPKPASDGLVTTLLPGEFKTVPDACSAVSAATLASYLPGKRHLVAPRSLFGPQASSCVWSVDKHPLYRWLQVSLRAYAPNGLAQGNGSATNAALGAYQAALAAKTKKVPHQAPAKVTVTHGLGESAFVATQAPTAEGATTDMVTVVARVRNVVVTVVFEGLVERHRYGPVSISQLRLGAVAFTREALARLS